MMIPKPFVWLIGILLLPLILYGASVALESFA